MRVAWLKDLRMTDLEQVGGKNASLGEMIGGLAAAGIRVPGGFATTAQAFREFLGELGPRIEERLRSLDPTDVKALAACGAEIRSWILKQPFSQAFEKEIRAKYQSLTESSSSETSFAVRSSATA
jgi:pyruvate,water dikinase